MTNIIGKKFIFVRHAEVILDGRFYGSRDIEAHPPNEAQIAATLNLLPPKFNLYTSPAKRCLTTCESLFPGINCNQIDEFREQDFGDWEGTIFSEIPDIGKLSTDQLFDFYPPNGESFADMAVRVNFAIDKILAQTSTQDCNVVVAHSGTIRAVISRLVGKSALSFQVDNLSATEIVFLIDSLVINYLNRNCN